MANHKEVTGGWEGYILTSIATNEKYKVTRKLGCRVSGFGTAYECVNLKTHKKACIKLVKSEHDLDRELEAFNQLKDCKNIHTPYKKDIFMYKGWFWKDYIVYGAFSKLMFGSLESLLNPTQVLLTVEELYPLCLFLYKTLEEIHSKQIIHRDVSPDNIFFEVVNNEKKWALADFGVAHINTNVHSSVDVEIRRSVAGKKYFMAPELRNSSKFSKAVDFWAAGVTILMATIVVLRIKEDASIFELFERHKVRIKKEAKVYKYIRASLITDPKQRLVEVHKLLHPSLPSLPRQHGKYFLWKLLLYFLLFVALIIYLIAYHPPFSYYHDHISTYVN